MWLLNSAADILGGGVSQQWVTDCHLVSQQWVTDCHLVSQQWVTDCHFYKIFALHWFIRYLCLAFIE